MNLSEVTTCDGIDYIGGLAGLVTGNTVIDNVDISSQLVGFNTVGGLIGGVRSSSGNIAVSITNSNYTDGYLSVLSSQNTAAYIGGFIGRVEGSVVLNINADAFEETTTMENNSTYPDYPENDPNWSSFVESVDSLEGDIYIDDDYKANANMISFGINVMTYMYNTSFDTYVGEIVGYMQNGLVTVRNTISSMNGSVSNLNMGLTSYSEMSERATITQPSFEHEVSEDETEVYLGASYNVAGAEQGANNIVRVQDLQGYRKGNLNLETRDEVVESGDGETSTVTHYVAVLPVYTFNISYNYYVENNSTSTNSCRLHLNNIGVVISNVFYDQNFTTAV